MNMSDEELEHPIRALAGLREPPPAGLLGRVRNAILRRHLAADVADLSVLGPMRLFLEYLRALFEGVLGQHATEDEDAS